MPAALSQSSTAFICFSVFIDINIKPAGDIHTNAGDENNPARLNIDTFNNLETNISITYWFGFWRKCWIKRNKNKQAYECFARCFSGMTMKQTDHVAHRSTMFCRQLKSDDKIWWPVWMKKDPQRLSIANAFRSLTVADGVEGDVLRVWIVSFWIDHTHASPSTFHMRIAHWIALNLQLIIINW